MNDTDKTINGIKMLSETLLSLTNVSHEEKKLIIRINTLLAELQIERVETAATKDGNVMNWKPIESAPKDKRILLLYDEEIFTGINIICGKWDIDRYVQKPQPHWTHDLSQLAGRRAIKSNQPSHWMDLEEL